MRALTCLQYPTATSYLQLFELELIIVGTILTSLALMLGTILLVVSCFLPAYISFMVFLCITMTIVDVFGLLALAGIALDTACFVVLVMAVGLCVDYPVHIALHTCHIPLSTHHHLGETREEQKRLFESIDVDGSGTISPEELLNFTSLQLRTVAGQPVNVSSIRAAFRKVQRIQRTSSRTSTDQDDHLYELGPAEFAVYLKILRRNALENPLEALCEIRLSTAEERTMVGMGEMGGAVIKGSTTTLLGMTAMAFASSGVYRTFFLVMLASVGLGVLHATVLLPVLLSVMEVTDNCFPETEAQGYDSVAAGPSDVVASRNDSKPPARNTAAVHPTPVKTASKGELDSFHVGSVSEFRAATKRLTPDTPDGNVHSRRLEVRAADMVTVTRPPRAEHQKAEDYKYSKASYSGFDGAPLRRLEA